MIDFVNKHGHNGAHSQNGEEGLLIEILTRLRVKNGKCVEVGASDGKFCSNTAFLLENDWGWTGKMIESDLALVDKCRDNWRGKDNVYVVRARVDGNLINLFVDDDCDVLSLDTDGGDFGIFKGLKAKPKIVIVEIDSSIPPDQRGFNQEGGAGYLEMILLAYQKGYTVLCHTGNLILIRDDLAELFPELNGTSALSDTELYFNRSWLKAA